MRPRARVQARSEVKVISCCGLRPSPTRVPTCAGLSEARAPPADCRLEEHTDIMGNDCCGAPYFDQARVEAVSERDVGWLVLVATVAGVSVGVLVQLYFVPNMGADVAVESTPFCTA